MTTSKKMFRYNTNGNWFKGNTHIHSIASDGGMSIPEIAELYSNAQYDFIFFTDHWVSSDVDNLYKQITRLDDLIVEQMAKIHRLEVRK